ncbi:hypothetical protein DSO57_1005244 [Entomophthora muscae]|uniref:Uncharacterized protein n=1 Tax=Entomophthora muscae TaxID=34485 RepID=A0ACC2U6N0_9FUNG|nr:hypothetical protein DSO57_1005244 [Entomophthora muscae]
MSSNSNYPGISNKTDNRQMVAQMTEEDCCHFFWLSNEVKMALLCGLCQAETGSLWSGLESLTYSCSLNEGDCTRESSEEIPEEEDNGGYQTSEREKHIGKVQQGAAWTQPQLLVIDPPSGAFLLLTQTGFQSEWESAPLFGIGDEGFSIPQLYWGVDIISHFLNVVMADVQEWT